LQLLRESQKKIKEVREQINITNEREVGEREKETG
jgi:hypothetical protein